MLSGSELTTETTLWIKDRLLSILFIADKFWSHFCAERNQYWSVGGSWTR
jgi:hypothetical protein